MVCQSLRGWVEMGEGSDGSERRMDSAGEEVEMPEFTAVRRPLCARGTLPGGATSLGAFPYNS